MYNEALKNKDKFFEESCLDFHNDDYSLSGCLDYDSYINQYSSECYHEEHELYDVESFMKESIKKIKSFLNRKSKKEYQLDTIVYEFDIELYNIETDDYDSIHIFVHNTYC